MPMLLRRLLLTLSLAAYLPAAAYTISGVSGTINNGSTLTVTASSGFGANGCSTGNSCVILFDDFEGHSAGAMSNPQSPKAGSGTWQDCGDSHPVLNWINDIALGGGTGAAIADSVYNGTGDYKCGQVRFPSFPDGQASNAHVYVAYWYYLPSSDAADSTYLRNYKVAWLLGGNSATPSGDTSNNDTWLPGWTGSGTTTSYSCNGCDEGTLYYTGNQSRRDAWTRVSLYKYYQNSSSGVTKQWEVPAGSDFDSGTEGDTSYTTSSGTNGPGRTSGFGRYHVMKRNVLRDNARSSGTVNPWPSAWNLNGCPNCGYGVTVTNTTHFDDVLVQVGDYAQSRVEITDKSTYPDWYPNGGAAGAGDDMTQVAVCIPSSWSDTSITCTLYRGPFVGTASAYMYVIDIDGNVSDYDAGTAGAQGYPITFAADAGAGSVSVRGATLRGATVK